MNGTRQTSSNTNTGYRSASGKKLPGDLNSFLGFVILAVSVCAAVAITYFLSLLFSGLSLMLGIQGVPADSFFGVVAGLIIVVAIPFALGTLARRWGWLLGLSYSVLYVFVSLYAYSRPFSFQSGPWYETGHPFAVIAIIVIPLATLAAFAGQHIMETRGRRLPLDIRHTFASVVPIVVISIMVAAIAIPTINKMNTEESEVLSFPEYNFQITKPAGSFALPSHITGTGDRIRRKATWEQAMSTHQGTYTGVVYLTIYVYEKMPFSGEPVTSFSSPEALYEKLKQNLDEFSQNYEEMQRSWGLTLNPDVVAYEWHGDMEVDGVDGVKYYYDERSENYPEDALADGPYDGDVVVYREPYLYCLNFFFAPHMPEDESREIYDELLDSFKFI